MQLHLLPDSLGQISRNCLNLHSWLSFSHCLLPLEACVEGGTPQCSGSQVIDTQEKIGHLDLVELCLHHLGSIPSCMLVRYLASHCTCLIIVLIVSSFSFCQPASLEYVSACQSAQHPLSWSKISSIHVNGAAQVYAGGELWGSSL